MGRRRPELRPHTNSRRPYTEPEPAPAPGTTPENPIRVVLDPPPAAAAARPVPGPPPRPAPPKVEGHPLGVKVTHALDVPRLLTADDGAFFVDEMVKLSERLDRTEALVQDLMQALRAAMDQAKAEAPKSSEDIAEEECAAVLGFMAGYPGMRMTGLMISENLTTMQITNSRVGHRLKTLHGRGQLKREERAGRTTMYWYEAQE